MSKIILDETLRAKLGDGRTGVEVCDESGSVVGNYLPQDEYMRLMYAVAKAELPPLSPEERAAALQEVKDGKFCTTEQILARLDQVRREWDARR